VAATCGGERRVSPANLAAFTIGERNSAAAQKAPRNDRDPASDVAAGAVTDGFTDRCGGSTDSRRGGRRRSRDPCGGLRSVVLQYELTTDAPRAWWGTRAGALCRARHASAQRSRLGATRIVTAAITKDLAPNGDPALPDDSESLAS